MRILHICIIAFSTMVLSGLGYAGETEKGTCPIGASCTVQQKSLQADSMCCKGCPESAKSQARDEMRRAVREGATTTIVYSTRGAAVRTGQVSVR